MPSSPPARSPSRSPCAKQTSSSRIRSSAPDHPEAIAARQDLADAYLFAGRFAAAELVPPRSPASGSQDDSAPRISAVAGMMATLGIALLKQQKWAEAESVLKQCLALREKGQPDDWTTFNTRSFLGDCLLAQSRFAEAEPLIIAGYEGMNSARGEDPGALPALPGRGRRASRPPLRSLGQAREGGRVGPEDDSRRSGPSGSARRPLRSTLNPQPVAVTPTSRENPKTTVRIPRRLLSCVESLAPSRCSSAYS